MRARYINEIKQDKESGLSAIGVGKAYTCRAYLEALNINDEVENYLNLDDKAWIFNDALHVIKPMLVKLLEVPISNIALVNLYNISNNIEEYLDSRVFFINGDHPDVEESQVELHWESSRKTMMNVYTNRKMGAVYFNYVEDASLRQYYYAFRKP